MLRAGLPRRPLNLPSRPHPIRPRHARSASSSRPAIGTAPSSTPLSSYLTPTLLLISAGAFAVYYSDSRSLIHKYGAMPLARSLLDAETAHRWGVLLLGSGLGPRDRGTDDALLACELWDLEMSSPVGIAAGLDKNAEAIDGLYNIGFSYVETGSITPLPQPGNPTPRLFRLPQDGALINRYGFNSAGHALVLARLRSRQPKFPEPGSGRSGRKGRVLAVNLGKNKTSGPDDVEDYLRGVRVFGPVADVLVVNVSSPNTPGLRALQGRGMLEELLGEVVRERDALPLREGEGGRRPRVVVKLAPDLGEQELEDVAEAVRSTGIDGVIMGNTTVQRPGGLKSPAPLAQETGGLSGPPLKPITIQAFKTLRSLLPASIPMIACGGISNAADALEYAKLGAATVQLYTAFGYDGVGLPREIKDDLAELLRKEGKSWREVSGEAVQRLAWKEENRDWGLERLKREAEKALDNLKEVSVQIALGDELVPNWVDPVVESPSPPPPAPEGPKTASAGKGAAEDVVILTPDPTSKEAMDEKMQKRV